MTEPLVVVSNLRKTYQHMGQPLEVLRGIDLSIDAGEMVSLIGKSGAGKSTLMHCLGTLDIPTAGSIKFDGTELTALGSDALAERRNRSIGFVFQFHHLLPEFTALENVTMPGLIRGMNKRENRELAIAILETVGLKHRMSHRPGELSGGEQQRVALARALVLSPKLLLADEPTGNLDTATSDSIHELFFDINRKHGTTIVIVTHNPALAESMPRIISLRDGVIESDRKGTLRS